MLTVNFLLLGAVLFCIGVFGVVARRNAVMVLMSVELILNAVNLNLIAFALMHGNVDGQVFALYVIAVAAAEVGVGPRAWCCSSTATGARSASTSSAR